jgi:hypothetical protein
MKNRPGKWLVTALILVAAAALGLFLAWQFVPHHVFAVFLPKAWLPRGAGGYEDGHPTSHWLEALDSDDDETRAHAIHCLGAIGPDASEAVPKLAGLLVNSPSSKVRSEAALTLQKMVPDSRTAVGELAQALEDHEKLVRMNAAIALMRLDKDAKPAVPALIKALKDKSNRDNLQTFTFTIQEEVALALGRATAGTTDGVAPLLEELKAFHEETRGIVIQTINRGKDASRKGSGKGTETHKLRAGDVIEIKISFARALGEIGPGGAGRRAAARGDEEGGPG